MNFETVVKQKGLTLSLLCQKTNITYGTLRSWQRKSASPNIQHLANMAKQLNISVSELAVLLKLESPDYPCLKSPLTFCQLLKRKKITLRGLSRDICVSTQMVNNWINNRNSISFKHAITLCNCLKINLDDLAHCLNYTGVHDRKRKTPIGELLGITKDDLPRLKKNHA